MKKSLKCLQGVRPGLRDAIKNPDAAVDAFIHFNPEAAEKRPLYLKVWKEMVARGFEYDSNGEPILGLPSEDSWSEKIQQMVSAGALDAAIPAEAAYTDEFV